MGSLLPFGHQRYKVKVFSRHASGDDQADLSGHFRQQDGRQHRSICVSFHSKSLEASHIGLNIIIQLTKSFVVILSRDRVEAKQHVHVMRHDHLAVSEAPLQDVFCFSIIGC